MYSNSNISLIDFSKDNCGNIGIRIENRKIIVWSKKENNKTINEFKSDTNISNESKWTHIALRSCIYNTSKYLNLFLNGIHQLGNQLEIDLFIGETNLNLIGKSDTLNIHSSSIIIDEIRIYDRTLNNSEIKNDALNTTECHYNHYYEMNCEKSNFFCYCKLPILLKFLIFIIIFRN